MFKVNNKYTMYHRQSSSIFTVNFEQIYFLYALVPFILTLDISFAEQKKEKLIYLINSWTHAPQNEWWQGNNLASFNWPLQYKHFVRSFNLSMILDAVEALEHDDLLRAAAMLKNQINKKKSLFKTYHTRLSLNLRWSLCEWSS